MPLVLFYRGLCGMGLCGVVISSADDETAIR